MKFIGSRRELFIDDWLIDELRGIQLTLHTPSPQEVVLRFDAPWEGNVSAYVTIFSDADLYRMYYRGEGHDDEPKTVTAYAESRDGIHWNKPAVNGFQLDKWPSNNIVLLGGGTHNFVPFKDTNMEATPEQRYKALASGPSTGVAGARAALVAFTSSDGVRWERLTEEAVIRDGAFDSQNVCFWDELRKQYVAFVRDFRGGVRTIRRSISTDFHHWSTPEWVEFGDAPNEHLYTSAITPYYRAPHIYLGFPMRFVPQRKLVETHIDKGVSDAVFMSSRDGLHWDRRFLEAFIRPNLDLETWTDRNIQVAFGIIPTGSNELSLYWIEHYRHATCYLRRGTLRVDGFVSAQAGYQGGELITKPFIFTGRALEINFATSAVGSVQVELQNANGQAYPGFELGEAMYGNSIGQMVKWPADAGLQTLAGKPVRLRFSLKDADLYSFRFIEQ